MRQQEIVRLTAIRSALAQGLGEGGLETLEGGIGRAEDGLAHVTEAVDHVPVVVLVDGLVGLQQGVVVDHGPQTVQLVRHRRGVHGHVVGPLDRRGHVVVLGVARVLDLLEAHTLCVGGSVTSRRAVSPRGGETN